MTKASKEGSLLAIHLIEEQLQVLPISIALILAPSEAGNAGPDLVDKVMHLQRRHRPQKTGSAGNIVADNAEGDTVLDFYTSNLAMHENPYQKITYLRVVISNALLAVGLFLKEHHMAEMRTPEIQFLEHVVDAILNANKFKIESGYVPMATFDGLVIDAGLNGSPLFGDGANEGFMEFGDAVALLQWLSRYLRGEKMFVSAGDAG